MCSKVLGMCSQWSDEYDSGSESAQEELHDEAVLRSSSDAEQADAADVPNGTHQFPARLGLLACCKQAFDIPVVLPLGRV